MGRTVAACAFASLLTAAIPASAQEKNAFAVGVNRTFRLANDESARGEGGFGISWRIGHSDAGWGWSYGLGWFDTNLQTTVGGRSVILGELKIRPIVAGYGYTYPLSDRLFVTADLVGGFAWTRFEIADNAKGGSAAASVLDSHVGAIPILRPELKAWYDINHKFGIQVSSWYALARPKLTIVTPAGRESSRVRADTFSLSAGVVYKIF